ncbi:hypothetical protein J3Q64DRAFT_1703657 [Phycomyces blakesleeanus]|uniref:Uncharacterized protein n=2 Tax=Phycomyces blakesleeanus TaxID=4837 RepID=A0A167M2F2_PHYB8|nr:hypothetical protein PHYBLDRAFT_170232 [Phycomyces blakesleeanus NRRL 1555(-)]OAD71574.1 hypothetical protein PHYBLDRAFT_170232 [Phycomyces blakesleeanus NRRL 1555(-)]|eukprot:XP_018289614.1 hypothetical protein PHYBLDRAFT_170232 [Phycomyces blakesleeanus NRRL 1555(-)]
MYVCVLYFVRLPILAITYSSNTNTIVTTPNGGHSQISGNKVFKKPDFIFSKFIILSYCTSLMTLEMYNIQSGYPLKHFLSAYRVLDKYLEVPKKTRITSVTNYCNQIINSFKLATLDFVEFKQKLNEDSTEFTDCAC